MYIGVHGFGCLSYVLVYTIMAEETTRLLAIKENCVPSILNVKSRQVKSIAPIFTVRTRTIYS